MVAQQAMETGMRPQTKRKYALPELPYDVKALAPHISEEQLRIHHDKHHQAYVTGANALLDRLDAAHKDDTEFDVKATLKELSFNIGGHILHSKFWPNMAPPGEGGGGKPGGAIGDMIDAEYGSYDRFKKDFTKTAMTVEGAGWSALTLCAQTERPLIMQIEKHSVNLYPTFKLLMVLDAFEHAYYIDYRNDKAKFFEGFWNIVNWETVNKRLE